MRRSNIILIVISVLMLAPAAGQAETLPQDLAKRAVNAVVKVGAVNALGRPTGFGSGTLIDPRGYVLTNFHVIGDKKKGEFRNPKNIVLLGMVKSARESVRYEWEGKVVRADPRLDLALIRITKSTSGGDLSTAQFPTIPVASTAELQPGSQVWVIGFPAGVRTVNMTAGTVAGFEMNLIKQVSWLRTDAEINPGNSGGQMVDSKGRLIGIPTQVRVADRRRRVLEAIGFARPAERIPVEWLQALKAGHINDTKIHGKFKVKVGVPLTDQVVGDQMSLSDAERRYYQLPADRPGILMVSDKRSIALFRAGRSFPMRTGRGEVEIKKADPHPLTVGIMFPQKTMNAATGFWLLFDKVDTSLSDLDSLAKNIPKIDVPLPLPVKKPPKVLLDAPELPKTFVFKGKLVDAVTGKGLKGLVLIGGADVDMKKMVSGYIKGTIAKSVFRKSVRIFHAKPAKGFGVSGIPAGRKYKVVIMAKGYRQHFITLAPKPGESIVNLGTLKFAR